MTKADLSFKKISNFISGGTFFKLSGKIVKKLAGKELAIGITIGFILMSFLMLTANNLGSGDTDDETNQIHASAKMNASAN